MKSWVRAAVFACAGLTLAVPGVAGAQSTGKPLAYRVTADIVAARICIPRLTFNPGDTIVFRAEIQDPMGVRLTADRIKALGVTAVITLKDGTKIPIAFGIHPPFPNVPATDTYWAGAYFVKGDHPTGTLPWTLTVSDAAGNVVNYTPIGQANGLSVLTIAEKAPAPPKT